MIKLILIAALLFSTAAHAGWWSDFCSRHLIADDPYQFEHLSVDQLVSALDRCQSNCQSIVKEIHDRLRQGLGYEDQEALVKALVRSRR
jgi:hypothetical protein